MRSTASLTNGMQLISYYELNTYTARVLSIETSSQIIFVLAEMEMA